MPSDLKAIQEPKLKNKIPRNEDMFTQEEYNSMIDDLLEDSYDIAMSLLYPLEDYSSYTLPTRYLGWQLRCCIELYNMADKQGFSSYAENGLSFTKLSDGLSNYLVSQIVPFAKPPQKREE